MPSDQHNEESWEAEETILLSYYRGKAVILIITSWTDKNTTLDPVSHKHGIEQLNKLFRKMQILVNRQKFWAIQHLHIDEHIRIIHGMKSSKKPTRMQIII